MKKWIKILNTLVIDFTVCENEHLIIIDNYDYSFNVSRLVGILDKQCKYKGYWQDRDIYTMRNNIEIHIIW